MDIVNINIQNMLRSVMTVLAFATFIGITLWAWSGARREQFAAAARMPLEDDDLHPDAQSHGSPNGERSGT